MPLFRKRRAEFRPRVVIDATALGPVNRLVLGANAEWTHLSEHRQLWNGPRLKKLVVERIKSMGVSTLRFPGGVHGDYYHWEWGAGPRPGRPAVLDPHSRRELEHLFGTDELLELSFQTDAMPWLQTNPHATAEETMEWSNYCRSKGSGVFYWEIGNEVYLADPSKPDAPNGAKIAMTLDEYTHMADAQLRALKADDPGNVVGAIGGRRLGADPYHAGSDSDQWTETVLRRLGPQIDFVAIHTGHAPLIGSPTEAQALDAFNAAASFPVAFKQNVADNLELIHSIQPRREIGLALTDWMPMFGRDGDAAAWSGALGAATFTAGMLHALLRERWVFAAHFTSLVHATMGAALTVTADGFVPSVNGAVFELYARHLGDEILAAQVTTELRPTPAVGSVPALERVPALDALATISEQGRIALFCINRNLEHSRTIDVDMHEALTFSDQPKAWTIAGKHFLETNGPAPAPLRARAPDDPIRIMDGPRLEGDRPWELTLPPSSVTCIEWLPADRPGAEEESGR